MTATTGSDFDERSIAEPEASDRAAVAYLFVPGSRADRFEKALGSGADRVIIDLEDAVGPDEKEAARAQIEAAVVAGLSAPVLVRINPEGSPWFHDDLQLINSLAAHPRGLRGVVMPKLETAEAVRGVRLALGPEGEFDIVGMLESAQGLSATGELASSEISRFAVGAVDLSVDLGTEIDTAVLDYIYAQTVIASRIAGIGAPIGSPPLDIHASEAIEQDARRLKGMGLAGQLCIHPAQVVPLQRGFAPTQAEIEWATRVVESAGASVQVDGQMVDKPVRERAERIIEFSRRNRS